VIALASPRVRILNPTRCGAVPLQAPRAMASSGIMTGFSASVALDMVTYNIYESGSRGAGEVHLPF
jgi:hypothetical protein